MKLFYVLINYQQLLKITIAILFVLIFNLFINPIYSQEVNSKELLPKWNKPVIFDRFGKKYELKDIDLNLKRDLQEEDILSTHVFSCNNSIIPDLSNYILNANPNGVFSGNGVVNTNGVFSFNPAIAGIGSHVIEYLVNSTIGCPSYIIKREIEVTSVCPKPFISQTYAKGTESTYIEIKNPSTTETIFAGTYFAVLYDGVNTGGMPTSSFDIGILLPGEVKVFQTPNASVPNYAAIGLNLFPIDFTFDGQSDVLVLSTSNGITAFNDRIDLVGTDGTDWCLDKSLVRSNCAVQYPRIDAFDLEDWVEFTLDEIENEYGENSKTNAVLGRHNDDTLTWNTSWTDGSTDESNPDRSRRINIANNYNTSLDGGSFEACSLTVLDNQILKITANDYVSSEGFVNVQDNAVINVENNGSLVQVKDQFQGTVGTDLITRGTNSQINISRTTVGLDAYTDYVYWSTPLANLPINNNTNTANNLFPSPPFNSSRFYGFENANFQDIPNWFNGASSTSPYANGYDDNLDDYFILTPTQRAQQLNAGLGYITWPPSACGTNCNYTITFSGTPNNGEITVPVYHNAPSNTYTNLVGNPYPSAINLDRFFEVNAGLIDPVAFVWGRSLITDDTPISGNPGPYPLSYNEDSYLIYNPTMIIVPNSFGNAAFDDPLGDGISDSGDLSSCQSFFVQTTTASGNLIFNNSIRTKVANNNFAKNSNHQSVEKDNKLWLNLKNDKASSQLGIAFLEKGHNEYNSKEDVKNIVGRSLSFYTKSTLEDLIIDTQSNFNVDNTIPLGVTCLKDSNQELSISIEKVTGDLKNKTIYLEDKLLKIIADITQKPYTFQSDLKFIDDRFVLKFNNLKSSNEVSKNEVNIIFNNSYLEIISATKKIKKIVLNDIYTQSFNSTEIEQLENLNCNNISVCIDEKYKIISVKVILEDGNVITKKMIK
ncbi:hypothetical protein [Flavobacterium sp.]|uniref:hypothetical protein n=1 Tax=Flavobacterium sp. TaxID=239 RepID=UPI003753178C